MSDSKNTTEQQYAKKVAGTKAADLIEDDMLVGLGTGTTATFFIDSLIKRCREGLKIQAVSSSHTSLKQAQSGGIPTLDINQISLLDITVDGADEIDPQKNMIKGGGGALFREKIIATMSREMVVCVDQSKCVKKLGDFPLAVEIHPFAFNATIAHINNLELYGSIREVETHKYITENGNYIYDIKFKDLIKNPRKIHEELIQIPGVIETGLFFNIAGRVVIGYFDGKVEVHN